MSQRTRFGDRLLLEVTLSVAVIACGVGGPGASPSRTSPSRLPAPSSTLEPQPITSGIPTGSPETAAPATRTPIATLQATDAPVATATARSEQEAKLFWDAVTPNGTYSHEYDTLASIVNDVDLIVVGRIANVYTGGIKTTDSDWSSIWAQVQIDDVLKGQPASRTPGFIDIALTSSPGWEWARDNVPDEELVLFLMNEADYRARVGQSPVDPDVERYMYWRPDEQAVIRNVGGTVAVIDTKRMKTDYGMDVFPLTVLGDDFERTIAAIRRAISAE